MRNPYLAVSLSLIAIAGVTFVDVSRLDVSVAYSHLGPADFPRLIAGGQLLLAALFLWAAARAIPTIVPAIRLSPVAWIVGGLLLQVAALPYLGFSAATAALFACTARAFGQKPFWLAYLAGLAFSFLTFLVFAKLLGLSLPRGPLEHLLS